MLRVTSAALAVLLCTACDGGSSSAKSETAAAAAKPDAKAESKADEPASSEPASSEPPPPTAAAADPLGQRFRDPPWFRENMFGDEGTKVGFARSEANEAGLFKSHLIFELPEGTDLQKCSSMVQEKLAKFTTLTPEEQPNDRMQLKGSTERYEVTAVCGEAKGKMRAYVAYEWTR